MVLHPEQRILPLGLSFTRKRCSFSFRTQGAAVMWRFNRDIGGPFVGPAVRGNWVWARISWQRISRSLVNKALSGAWILQAPMRDNYRVKSTDFTSSLHECEPTRQPDQKETMFRFNCPRNCLKLATLNIWSGSMNAPVEHRLKQWFPNLYWCLWWLLIMSCRIL